MIPTYPKEITALVDALGGVLTGRMTPAECGPALEVAEWGHRRAILRAHILRAVTREERDLSGTGDELLALLQERGSLLSRIAATLGGEDHDLLFLGKELQEVSHRIAIVTDTLEEARKALQGSAAIPLLDEIVKVGLAVHQEGGAPGLLVTLLPELVRFHRNLSRTVDALNEAYPGRPELGARFQEGLSMLEQGGGAIEQFLEQPGEERRSALLDGVTLLARGEAVLGRARVEVAELRRKEGLSELPALDRFGRVARRVLAGTLPAERLPGALAELREYLSAEEGSGSRFLDTFFLRPGIREEWDREVRPEFRALVEELGILRQESARTAEAGGVPPAGLERRLSGILRRGERAVGLQQALMRRGLEEPSLTDNPVWDEVREAVKGVYYGIVPKHLALLRVSRGLRDLEAVAVQVEGVAPLDRPRLLAVCAEVRDLLGRLARAVEDDGRDLLPGLVADLEGCCDRWLWVEDTLDQAAAERLQVPCVQCGEKNRSSARFCGKCGARLLVRPEEEPPPGLDLGEEEREDGGSGRPSRQEGSASRLLQLLEEGGDLSSLLPMLRECLERVRTARAQLALWNDKVAEADLPRLTSLALAASSTLNELEERIGRVLAMEGPGRPPGETEGSQEDLRAIARLFRALDAYGEELGGPSSH